MKKLSYKAINEHFNALYTDGWMTVANEVLTPTNQETSQPEQNTSSVKQSTVNNRKKSVSNLIDETNQEITQWVTNTQNLINNAIEDLTTFFKDLESVVKSKTPRESIALSSFQYDYAFLQKTYSTFKAGMDAEFQKASKGIKMDSANTTNNTLTAEKNILLAKISGKLQLQEKDLNTPQELGEGIANRYRREKISSNVSSKGVEKYRIFIKDFLSFAPQLQNVTTDITNKWKMSHNFLKGKMTATSTPKSGKEINYMSSSMKYYIDLFVLYMHINEIIISLFIERAMAAKHVLMTFYSLSE